MQQYAKYAAVAYSRKIDMPIYKCSYLLTSSGQLSLPTSAGWKTSNSQGSVAELGYLLIPGTLTLTLKLTLHSNPISKS